MGDWIIWLAASIEGQRSPPSLFELKSKSFTTNSRSPFIPHSRPAFTARRAPSVHCSRHNGSREHKGRGARQVPRAQDPGGHSQAAPQAILPSTSTCESLLGSFIRIVVCPHSCFPEENADKSQSPASPDEMDWSTYFPAFVDETPMDDSAQPKRLTKDVEVVDIGCGFGGLLVALAPVMPDKLMLGE